MWIEPPVDLDGQVVKRPGQVSRNYHLQLICWQILTRPCLPFVYVVAIHRLFCITIWKFNPFGFISTRYDNLVPEALFYSFLANFATRNAFFIFFFIGTKRWEPRKVSIWSRLLGSSLSCHQLLTVVSDWRIFLIALRIIWLNGLNIFGDVIGQKKMTSLTAVKCWAAWMWDSQRSWPEAFFSLGSGLPLALRVANFQIEKIILKESLWDQGIVTSKIVWNRRWTLEVRFFKNIQNWIF